MLQEIEDLIARRASEDAVYRQALLNDPLKALFDFHGLNLDPAIRVRIVEEETNEFILRIPPPAVGDPVDIDLDDVDESGGFYASGCLQNTCSATCVSCDDKEIPLVTS